MADEVAGAPSYAALIELAEKLAAAGTKPTDAEADQLKVALSQLLQAAGGKLDFSDPANSGLSSLT